MEWIIFALLTPAFRGMNKVLNKFLITKKISGFYAISVYLNLIDLLFIIPVPFFTSISFLFPYALIAVAGGALPVLAFWFNFKALQIEEVSRVAPLFYLTTIFVILLSIVFLGEILNAQNYLGIVLIILTSILISYKKSEKGKPISAALKYMIPYTGIFATYSIMNKYLLGYVDYWSLYFWAAVGSAITALVMLAFKTPRKELAETMPLLGKKTFVISFTTEGVYVLGIISSLVAMSLGPVSLVSTLGNLQNIFVFGYTLIISLIVPRILKEELTRNVIIQKTVAIAIMFVGTWLIAM